MVATAIVFASLGMFYTLCLFLYTFEFGYFVWMGLSIGFGVWSIVSMAQKKKYVGCGVCCLIFTNIVAGILYLCWNPNKKKPDDTPTNTDGFTIE